MSNKPSKFYRVELTNKAEKSLKQLPTDHQVRIANVLLELQINPRPNGVKKLKGEWDFYRVRVGDYRVVYEIFDQEIRVVVIAIGHRREIYR
jgi:mRNA interferase RelE/StbE